MTVQPPFSARRNLATPHDAMRSETRPGARPMAASAPTMALRRTLFFALVGASIVALLGLFIAAVSVDGFGLLDLVSAVLFAFLLPWSVIGFWNATIGFALMRLGRDVAGLVLPGAAETARIPITSSTAILFCIRNEDVSAIRRALLVMIAGLQAGDMGQHFALYILSDTTDAGIAADEEQLAAELARGALRVVYRRREYNRDFKAGNIRDFCERWGAEHAFMITLDADSLMSAQAMLRLVTIMEADDRLGIVQHLTVGLPSLSPFARIFQFGMRLGMRSYTLGSAWWQGECGPYWGHNAILRLAPFTEHCRLEHLPGTGALSGPILSHDQVEAILMRRAGYECRVLVEERGSYEANPTTLAEFIRRDLRWCQGNMQYWRLLGLEGASAISQYQLCFAILMFVGSPAAVLLTMLSALRLLLAAPEPGSLLDAGPAEIIVAAFVVMSLAPKLATLLDVLARPDLRHAFGGTSRILASAAIELVFMILTLPILTVSEALFLAGLSLRRRIGWGAQKRGEHRLSLGEAARGLWPHTLLGMLGMLAFGFVSAAAFWWSLPLLAGLVLAIPLAVATSSPSLGMWLARNDLCVAPEEIDLPPEIVALDLPALRPF